MPVPLRRLFTRSAKLPPVSVSIGSGRESATSTKALEGVESFPVTFRFRLPVDRRGSSTGVAKGLSATMGELDALSGVSEGVEGVDGRP